MAQREMKPNLRETIETIMKRQSKGESVSNLTSAYGIHPSRYYMWRKRLLKEEGKSKSTTIRKRKSAPTFVDIPLATQAANRIAVIFCSPSDLSSVLERL